jgi:transcriptional regulator with XRE-family HTH domain
MELDLRKLRDEKNLKQSELADILGVKQPYISSIERGRYEISHEVLERLKDKFPDIKDIKTDYGESKVIMIDESEAKNLLNIIAEQLQRIKEKDEQISRLISMVEDCQQRIAKLQNDIS